MAVLAGIRAWWGKSGLQVRLTLQIAGAIVALFALILSLVLFVQSHAIRTATLEHGFALVRIFAFSSVQSVLAEDFLSLRALVRSLARQPEVRYAMVQDLNGRVLMHSRVENTGGYLTDGMTQRAIQTDRPLVQETVTEAGERLYDFAGPVLLLNERRAVARIGISRERESQLLRRTRNVILAIGACALLAGFVWVRIHVRRLARPIEQLSAGADAIARGQLGRRIAVARSDEVGRLAAAFNQMAESLKVRFEVDRELSSTLKPDLVLEALARHAHRMARADLAFIAAPERNAEGLVVAASDGAIGPHLRGWRIRPGIGRAGAVVAEGRPQRIDGELIEGDGEESAVLREERIRHLVLVPIQVQEKTVGVLGVARRGGDGFGVEAEELLCRLADQAAVALANAFAYREIEQLNLSLESKVAERTKELQRANTELETSQAKLRELDRLKSEFVSNVSHELRTPLAVIRASVENLLDGVAGEVSPILLRSLARVKDNTDRLVRLITDLLDLSRIEAGRIEIRLAPVPLDPVIRDVVEGFRPMAAQKSLAVSHLASSEPVVAMADRDRLQQILVNLVGNAVKFTPPGGLVTVAARLGAEAERLGGCAVVLVKDTGEGIPPDKLAAIFDKFYQVRRDGRPKAPGTGLGLAIAKSLIELQGGRIWVESQPGRGSHFAFTLPLAGPSPCESPP